MLHSHPSTAASFQAQQSLQTLILDGNWPLACAAGVSISSRLKLCVISKMNSVAYTLCVYLHVHEDVRVVFNSFSVLPMSGRRTARRCAVRRCKVPPAPPRAASHVVRLGSEPGFNATNSSWRYWGNWHVECSWWSQWAPGGEALLLGNDDGQEQK